MSHFGPPNSVRWGLLPGSRKDKKALKDSGKRDLGVRQNAPELTDSLKQEVGYRDNVPETGQGLFETATSGALPAPVEEARRGGEKGTL